MESFKPLPALIELLSRDAGAEKLHETRARASALAVRRAHALAVRTGSRSAIYGDIAERSTREASLLLFYASRPTIKTALLDRIFNGS